MPKNIFKNDIDPGQVLYEWNVSEYDEHPRNLFWYIFMTAAGLLLVGYALFTGNFLFALIIVLFAIIIFLQSHQKPHVIPFRITENGVLVNSRFYTYSELDSFYLVYNPPEVKTLFIETAANLRPRLRVPLGDMDPNEIRFTLREFLLEDTEKEEEPFSDMIARRWMLH